MSASIAKRVEARTCNTSLLLAKSQINMSEHICRAVKEKQRAEVVAAELRGKGEAELDTLRAAVAAADQRTAEAHAATAWLESELRDYKACPPLLVPCLHI